VRGVRIGQPFTEALKACGTPSRFLGRAAVWEGGLVVFRDAEDRVSGWLVFDAPPANR
jgi:hypothetical protein